MIAEGIGLSGESVMLTSNNTSPEEFKKARQIGAIINLDDSNHLSYLESLTGLPEILCLRYNPGPVNRDNHLAWKELKENKFGMRKDQLFETYLTALKKGIRRFGLHIMIMSNDLDEEKFLDTTRTCFDIAKQLHKRNIDLEFIDLGGGLGIPYRPYQKAINLEEISSKIQRIYEKSISNGDFIPLRLFVECGRLITGPHGYLVATVRHIKETYKRFAGLDASMTDLMRPGMYGSYHHISVLGKNNNVPTVVSDVVGSVCENNVKCAIKR